MTADAGSARSGTTPRTVDWHHELVEQLEWHWPFVRRRLEGLTDEEHLWEPVAGCWSLRPRADARATGYGAGDVVMEIDVPGSSPPPFTTIAWRIAHIAVDVFGARAANHFGDGGVSPATTEWSLDAAGALALLDRHHDAWRRGVQELGPEGLARPCGPAEGPFAEYPLAALVLHINREAIHHAAEVGVLRDLWAHRPIVEGSG